MKIRVQREGAESGAALLLSLLVLFVLVAIVFQINVTTGTDARMARNDVGVTTMELAIESALLQVFEQLIEDGEAQAAGDAGGMPGAPDPGADPAEGEGEESSEPSDSREDEWAKPQQTSFEEMGIRLRILVQDEDSKFNVLAMLSEDEEESEQALERVARILDLCREGTDVDIDSGDADQMAREMLEFMTERGDAFLPRAVLLTDDEENEHLGLPLSLRDFDVLESFKPNLFRDYRDEDDTIVHSIGTFLTVWSSVGIKADLETSESGASSAGAPDPEGNPDPDPEKPDPEVPEQPAPENPEAGGDMMGGGGNLTGGAAGWAVNVNTAPPAVLKALVDERDLSSRFWDEVIRYRNEEEEPEEGEEETDPVYDEFGEEVIPYQIFDSISELASLDDWIELDSSVREELNKLLRTQSQVFSIYITAIRKTGVDEGWAGDARDSREEFERSQGNQLVRTVRCVVWRNSDGEETQVIPIIRWEVVDYVPFEVLDYPDEDR